MSVKSKGRRIGRMIRRATGLSLPVAMKIGKMVAQNRDGTEIADKCSAVSVQHFVCGDRCCSYPIFVVTGPKGNIVTDYALSEADIIKDVGSSQG